jgi:hypothetical protein
MIPRRRENLRSSSDFQGIVCLWGARGVFHSSPHTLANSAARHKLNISENTQKWRWKSQQHSLRPMCS